MQNKTEDPQDLFELYDRIKTDLRGYITNRLNWVKLSAYEKMALSGAHIGFMLIVVVLSIGVFFLGIAALGLLLGEMLNSYAAGFGVMVLATFIMLMLVVLLGKPIRRLVSNIVIMIIKKVESNEE